MLIMLCFTRAIDKCVICNTAEPFKSAKDHIHFFLKHISTARKAKWKSCPSMLSPWGVKGAQPTAFLVKTNLPKSTACIKDTEVGGAADFRYHIIYGSHIVGVAFDCFIEIPRVQAQTDRPVGFDGDRSRVNPRAIFILDLNQNSRFF